MHKKLKLTHGIGKQRLWIYSIIVLNYIKLRVCLVSEIFFKENARERK